MDVLVTGAGVLIIALVVVEVFNDLFHPTGSGALSDWLGRHLFNLFRDHPVRLPLAGPLAVLLTINAWVLLLVAGFALVYYPSMPDAFRTSTGIVPPERHRLLTALYFSAQTLTTLAFGDIVAKSAPMRFASTAQGFIGFGVVTASVSSIVLIYPAISRMRLLARGVSHLVQAERANGTTVARSGSDVVLANLARDVTNTRIDLIHFPLVYFFSSHAREGSLGYALPHMVRMAREGREPDVGARVQLAAAALDGALDDLSVALASRFLHCDPRDRDAVFAAVARDHEVTVD